MKTTFGVGLLLTIFMLMSPSMAQTTILSSKSFPPVKWVSKGTQDPVTIANGQGEPITIQISVDKTVVVDAKNDNKETVSAGINIKNCGSTTHVDSGSSVICDSADATNPVTFTADSETVIASGNYQVKSQY